MAKRRNVGGRYVETRERSTSKGAKGTIMKKWSSKSPKNKKEESQRIMPWIFLALILLLILYLISLYI